jgi:UDP:flavonoid glycosyltransferase YjiC (YdhE family)
MILLLPNCAFLSETSRMIEIARALRRRGEEVMLATRGGPYLRVVEGSGLPWTRLDPPIDDHGARDFLDHLLEMGHPGARPMLTEEEIRSAVAREVALIRSTGASAVVIGFTLTGYLSSRVAGVPLVASHGGSFVPPVFERRLAPIPSSPPPGFERMPRFLQRLFANLGPSLVRAPTRELNRVAAELGVEPVPSLAALMLADLTLVTDVPEILGVPREELESWRPRTGLFHRKATRLEYVGPLFARLDMPITPEVDAFLSGPSPTALVSLSSSTAEMVRDVTRRVRDAGARVLVASTVHQVADLASDRVLVGGILPNHLVMPRVDLAVTMGGQGTVQTAIASGTPLVGFPLQPEQDLNVAIIERLGMGVRLPPAVAATAATTEAVRSILDDLPRYRDAARRAQAHYAGVDGADNAASAILRRVGRSAEVGYSSSAPSSSSDACRAPPSTT